jgi:ATP-dependent protease Clp ATPase subunit
VISAVSGEGVPGVLRALLKVIEGARSVDEAERRDTAWHP